MLKKYKSFSLLFLVIFLLQLISGFFPDATLAHITRPCIVLSLMIFFVLKTKLYGRFHKRLFTGLLFAWLTDLLLTFNSYNASYMRYAFAFFLLAHIFYIRAFYLDFLSAQELDKKNARIAIAACTIYGMGFYILIRPYLGVMKLPMMAFIFIFSMMLMMAVFRNLRVNRQSFILIFAGALLLVLADSLMAYQRFVNTFSLDTFMIMCSYMAAQYLLVMGGVERKLLNK
jgi:uncharacterized membrane protein YhhN